MVAPLPLALLYLKVSAVEYPKGILVVIGGAEDKGTDLERGVIERNRLNFFELGILSSLLSLIGDDAGAGVELVTTASQIPDEVAANYATAFSKLGCEQLGHMRIRNREDAARPEYLERLQRCRCVMFSGGNQLRLSSIFGGTRFLQILRERYQDEHFIIAGTSAGAMAMSETMIYEGNATRAHLKGEVKITTGLGLLHGVIIDSHFDKRGRFNRLAQAVAAQPGAIGIGLGEDTGVIVRDGRSFTVIGNGCVTVIDGKNIDYNNIGDVDFGKPIGVENLIVHLMSMGDGYDLTSRHSAAAAVTASDDD